MIDVHLIPILKDNYSYVLTTTDGICAVLDPGEAEPIINYLDKHNLKPDFILNTHHHWDHVDGNQALKQKYGLKIVAPAKEVQKIGNVDITLHAGDFFMLGTEKAKILAAEGHTAGGIMFSFEDSKIIFVGDTLFSMGCGRLFEGTAAQMFSAFQDILALPDDTKIYCGHEYTLSNGAFCHSIEPENADIKTRIENAKKLRAQNLPTIPTTLGLEKKTNLFLTAKSAEEFAALRLKRNNF